MTKQHSSAGLAPTGRKCSRQQLGLVVAAVIGATLACGCPRDDIDLRWVDTPAELVGKIAHDAAPVPKLEPDDELFW
jgi:hypothetical protein